MNTTKLPPNLQYLVDIGESGTDIIHGKLKSLMLEAEEAWGNNRYSPEGKYHEGQLDAYAKVYELTYQLAFAIADRRNLTNN